MITSNLRRTVTAVALLATLGMLGMALPSDAFKYRPPADRQRPNGRQGAATRGPCVRDQFVFAPLLPTSNYGQTVAAYPTLHWYQANHTFSWMRFRLYNTQNQTPESYPIYETTLQLQNNTPLVSLKLPDQAGFPALEVGREYLWKVTLICSQGGPDDDSADGSQQTIQGWLTRSAPSPTLQSQLRQTQRPYEVYAEEGFWYDAVSDLATRRQQQPQDPQLAADWQALLKETALASTPVATQP
ncbi:MAG: DUF928 domain-containing protein [Thermosynechococcaceae cyanobacterium]